MSTQANPQVVITVRAGVVIVEAQGQKQILDRFDTDRFVINMHDHTASEQPDAETWTPFEQAVIYRNGRLSDADEYEVWQNNLYVVNMREQPDGHVHLSIRANDRHWRHDWRHLQRIKNELCGPEREAIELYPAESRLVDQANQFHLWVLPEGMAVPVGFTEREVSGDAAGWSDGSRQRPMVAS